jgi:hypothetical protein
MSTLIIDGVVCEIDQTERTAVMRVFGAEGIAQIQDLILSGRTVPVWKDGFAAEVGFTNVISMTREYIEVGYVTIRHLS